MSRVYGTTDRGERVLVWLECDRCPAKIRPGPHIMESGWRKAGTIHSGDRGSVRYDYCPECWNVVGPDWEIAAENSRRELERRG